MTAPALSIDITGNNTKFKKSLDDSGRQADKAVDDIESKFEDFDPQLNLQNYTKSLTSMVAGFGVAGTVAAAVLGLVVNLNKSLADTGEIADRVGLSFERFQQLKFGANSLGIGGDDFNASMDAFAKNIQNAQFKANDLTRAFQANGVAINDANGKQKDTNTLLNAAVDIIKRAKSAQDAIQLGGFFGLSQDFSQKIREGGDAFLTLAAQANAAGAVVDEATIQKAKIFSQEWTKAAAIWSTSLKAAVGDILPLLNDAVNGAVTVINAIKSAYSFISAIKDFAIAPNIDTASLNQLNSLLKQYQDIRVTLESGKPLNPIQLFQGTNAEDSSGNITKESVDNAINAINTEIQKRQKDVQPIKIPVTGGSINPGPSTGGDGGRDQFETAVDTITKHTATINADTAAVFQNKQAQAQLRAEFQLLQAIQRDGGEVTQDQIEKYELLRASMSQQEALTAAGISLNKDHADSFARVSDSIATATGRFTQAQDSLQKMNALSQQFGSALSNSFADAVVEGKSLGEVLSNLGKQLEKMAINSIFGSFFNAPSTGGVSPFLSLLGIGHNAGGTDNWGGGPTWVGENGPEIVNLPKGSQVVPNSVAVKAAGGISVDARSYPTFQAGMTPTDMAQIQSMLRVNSQQTQVATINAIRNGNSRDSRFLG